MKTRPARTTIHTSAMTASDDLPDLPVATRKNAATTVKTRVAAYRAIETSWEWFTPS
jgi:hypothetical protein